MDLNLQLSTRGRGVSPSAAALTNEAGLQWGTHPADAQFSRFSRLRDL